MKLLNDAKHWRDRAEEIRSAADDYRSFAAREQMLRLADDYDKLAERADERNANVRSS